VRISLERQDRNASCHAIDPERTETVFFVVVSDGKDGGVEWIDGEIASAEW
jgi:hypothetical protein